MSNLQEYQAAAWDKGWFAAREFYVKSEAPEDGIEANPYRITK